MNVKVCVQPSYVSDETVEKRFCEIRTKCSLEGLRVAVRPGSYYGAGGGGYNPLANYLSEKISGTIYGPKGVMYK